MHWVIGGVVVVAWRGGEKEERQLDKAEEKQVHVNADRLFHVRPKESQISPTYPLVGFKKLKMAGPWPLQFSPREKPR